VSELEAYGLGAAALIALAFYVLRRVPAFAATASLVAIVFTVLAYPAPNRERFVEWCVQTIGLFAMIAGLLFVRAMLARSVSLRLLASIDEGAVDSFEHDIEARVADMRAFRLARTIDGRNTLTAFGRAVAALAASSYYILKIDG
jgi:hypothetical protein